VRGLIGARAEVEDEVVKVEGWLEALLSFLLAIMEALSRDVIVLSRVDCP
jgi:hypothetical protein